jgi:hypothetical protein
MMNTIILKMMNSVDMVSIPKASNTEIPKETIVNRNVTTEYISNPVMFIF